MQSFLLWIFTTVLRFKDTSNFLKSNLKIVYKEDALTTRGSWTQTERCFGILKARSRIHWTHTVPPTHTFIFWNILAELHKSCHDVCPDRNVRFLTTLPMIGRSVSCWLLPGAHARTAASSTAKTAAAGRPIHNSQRWAPKTQKDDGTAEAKPGGGRKEGRNGAAGEDAASVEWCYVTDRVRQLLYLKPERFVITALPTGVWSVTWWESVLL